MAITQWDDESSPETDCSVDMVDLVYAEGSGETECLVDIVSGLVDTHSHMHVSACACAHTYTHTDDPKSPCWMCKGVATKTTARAQ